MGTSVTLNTTDVTLHASYDRTTSLSCTETDDLRHHFSLNNLHQPRFWLDAGWSAITVEHGRHFSAARQEGVPSALSVRGVPARATCAKKRSWFHSTKRLAGSHAAVKVWERTIPERRAAPRRPYRGG